MRIWGKNVSYLGFDLTENGISPLSEKVSEIINVPAHQQ